MSITQQRILILGLGGGGGRITARLSQDCRFPLLHTAVADTDVGELDSFNVDSRIPLGREWTGEEGCGGDPVRGERAVTASAEDLDAAMQGARLVVGVAGLGGGTGAGACKVVARLARNAKVPAMFVVTLPFSFEGDWRRQNADKALEPLRELADAVIVIPNDRLFSALSADTPGAEAFRLADALLAEGVAGLARIFSAQGLITAGLDNVKAILGKRAASCSLGVGKGDGPDSCRQALEGFQTCPLTGGRESLQQVHAGVLTLLCGNDLSFGEIQGCLEHFQGFFPRKARLEVGAYVDGRAGRHVQLTALMCSYDTAPGLQTAGGSTPGTPTRTSKQTTRKPARTDANGQFELPLKEQTLGIFKPGDPTLLNGQNLDIPTFQRRGVDIDIGD